MATQTLVFTAPFTASSNVSAITYTGNPATYSSGGIPQFCVVTLDTATGNGRDVKLATANTDQAIGILQNSGPGVLPGSAGLGAVAAGDACDVAIHGISKVQAGGAITVGQQVAVNASGQVVAAPAAGVSQVFIIGRALTAATAAGDLVEVLLMLGAATQVNA